MGKNNRARRAAKKKRNARKSGGSPTTPRRQGCGVPGCDCHLYDPVDTPDWFGGPDAESKPLDRDLAEELFAEMVAVLNPIDAVPAPVRSELLGLLSEWDSGVLLPIAERTLSEAIRLIWYRGWTPSEVVRQTRRFAGAETAAIVLDAVAVDHQQRPPDSIHPEWQVHLDALPLDLQLPERGWLEQGGSGDVLGASNAVIEAARAVGLLRVLPEVHPLIPPPGSAQAKNPIVTLPSDASSSVLAKVRALLTQAESTNFEAEAETFTAKAQELMARHSIDVAMLWSENGTANEPDVGRIEIDDPYADVKSLLLQIVADHSQCRAVFSKDFGYSSIVGFRNDIIATETLFTSLLVQAQSALRSYARSAPPGARTRSAAFRSSFLQGYAGRIGERLAEVNASVKAQATAEHGESLLPVLADRTSAVDDAYSEHFPSTTSSPVRGGSDWLGRSEGAEAADRAQLVTGAVNSG